MNFTLSKCVSHNLIVCLLFFILYSGSVKYHKVGFNCIDGQLVNCKSYIYFLVQCSVDV